MLNMEDQFMIRHLHNEGLTISEIRRQTGYDRKTVRKYIAADGLLQPSKRQPRGSILDPYKEYIQNRLKEYPLSAVRHFEEIKDRGYPGKYTLVKEYVRRIKRSTGVLAEYRYETAPGIQA